MNKEGNMKEIKFKGANHIKKFKCIGSACEENCCSKWNVELDQPTFLKYKNFSAPEFKLAFESSFVQYPILKRRAHSYGVLNLTETKTCPFLTHQGLCGVQEKFGEDYLSLVCASFPRITHLINDQYERTLSLSCPEAARIVLLDKEKFKMLPQSEPSTTSFQINQIFHSKKNLIFNPSKKYFELFRGFSYQLVGNSSLELWERLILLSHAFEEIRALSKKKRWDEIQEFIEAHSKRIDRNFLREMKVIGHGFQEKKIDILIQFFLAMKKQKESSPNYSEVYQMVEEGLGLFEKPDPQHVLKKYQEAYQNTYKSFFSKNPHILENYLLNHMTRDIFPRMFPGSAHNSIIALIVQYSIVKFHLIGVCSFKKTLTEEDVVKVIFSFSRAFSHWKLFYMNMIRFMRVNRFDDLKYFACLLVDEN
jgi:lysine-N-methylase